MALAQRSNCSPSPHLQLPCSDFLAGLSTLLSHCYHITRPALIDTGLTGAHSVGCCVRKHFLITTHNPIPLNSKIRIRAVCFLILHSVEKPSLGRIELAAARHAHVTIR
ncbi:hypothetical protein HZ326_23466 [Fusarium oxysporum f. sp. albedinis]|nr:hypothetical protein HZ326_23466 [Fusarium oxysporum f. sp. albedinis]